MTLRFEYTRSALTVKVPLVRVCQALAAFLIVSVSGSPAWADDYERMAAPFAKAAAKRGLKRVAVIPFQNLSSRDSSPSGRIVSERLVGPLIAVGDLEVVERVLLDSILKEQKLQNSGVVDPRSASEIGRILEVDAVLTGTVLSVQGGRVEVNARLIETRSARVLYAVNARVKKDWEEGGLSDLGGLLPSFSFAAPAFAGEWTPSAPVDCRKAEREADDLDERMLELKARYWAQRLREGLDRASLTRNPGSEIRAPQTRARFYERLKFHAALASGRLSDEEAAALRSMNARVEELVDACTH